MKSLTQDHFITNCKLVHGDFYDYSKTVYKNTRSKIIVICPIHGKFEQIAKQHTVLKRGCRKCGDKKNGVSRSVTVEHFISQARKIHGDKYDYSEVEFDNYRNKIKIICKEHGIFEQRLSKHLYDKQGCKRCAVENNNTFDFTRTKWIEITSETGAYLYLKEFQSENESFYKIGITKNLKRRFYCKGIKGYKIKTINSLYEKENTGKIFDLEKKFHRENRNLRYKPIKKFDGRYECYIHSPEILKLWENLNL